MPSRRPGVTSQERGIAPTEKCPPGVRFIGLSEGTKQMVTIGVDPHKQTHTRGAVDALGSELAQRTGPARRVGFGELLRWGRKHDPERVWVIEDVRHVSGGMEPFLSTTAKPWCGCLRG